MFIRISCYDIIFHIAHVQCALKEKRTLMVEYVNTDEYIKLVDSSAQLNSLRCTDKCVTICGYFHCSALPFSFLILLPVRATMDERSFGSLSRYTVSDEFKSNTWRCRDCIRFVFGRIEWIIPTAERNICTKNYATARNPCRDHLSRRSSQFQDSPEIYTWDARNFC